MAKILIIDDDKIIRDRLKELLVMDDFEILVPENTDEGLRMFDTDRIDVALVDIRMPKVDGITFLRHIKEKKVDTEVIMITGHGGVDTAIEAMKDGAFSYLQKPLDYDELLIEIARALEKTAMQKKLDEYVKNLEIEIAERKQAEESLRQSEEQYRSLCQHAYDAIFMLDKDGKILFSNESATTLFEYPNGELIGKPIAILIPEKIKQNQQIVIRQFFTTGSIYITGRKIQVSGQKKSGNIVPLELSLVPWKHMGSIYFTTILRDRSKEEEAEKKFREAHLLAEAVDQYKCSFFRRTSKRIRLIYQAIVGYAEALGCEEVPALQKKSLSIIKRKSANFADILSDMIDISSFDMKRGYAYALDFNLEFLVRSVVRIVEGMEDGALEIEVAYAIGRRFFKGDPTRIRQLLLTLLHQTVSENRHGSISVCVHADAGADGVRNNVVHIDIRNRPGNGTGTPNTVRKKSSENEIDFINEILSRMEGSIGLEKNGYGNYTLSLMLEEAQEDTRTYGDRPFPPVLDGRTAFIVEESEELMDLLGFYCRSIGIRTTKIIKSPRDAIPEMSSLVGQAGPDYLIIRLDMEDRDFIDFSRAVGEIPGMRASRLVALSAHAVPGVARELEAAGYHGFISIPFSSTELVTVLGILGQPGCVFGNIVTRYFCEERTALPENAVKNCAP